GRVTRCSYARLGLPLTIARCVATTAETGVLEETAPFLEGRAVEPHEDSYYDLPRIADERASLYEHGVRAITRALQFGPHGLSLMGTGDWNDGMNLVGEGGVGESVWLGFFLFDVLSRYSEVASAHGDAPFSEQCKREALRLQGALEQHGWAGDWYRRAYFDDGTPLGSQKSPERVIDSISQSWSVLSCAARSDRRERAMNVLDERRVRRKDQLVQLL